MLGWANDSHIPSYRQHFGNFYASDHLATAAVSECTSISCFLSLKDTNFTNKSTEDSFMATGSSRLQHSNWTIHPVQMLLRGLRVVSIKKQTATPLKNTVCSLCVVCFFVHVSCFLLSLFFPREKEKKNKDEWVWRWGKSGRIWGEGRTSSK